jgi:hypothetical protein
MDTQAEAMDTQAEERAEETTEYPWVAELRAAGLNVRTGTGRLNRVPDAYFGPPPGFRTGIRAVLRSVGSIGVRVFRWLTR